MHGDSGLFRGFASALGAPSTAVAYPPEAECYETLVERATAALPQDPVVVVAESYSGPVGVLLAHRRPERVRALVLVATFARSPLPRWTWPLTQLMRFPVTGLAVRSALVGPTASGALVREVQDEVRQVPGEVLVSRAQQILETDVTSELARVEQPVLYLHASRDALLWGARSVVLEARPQTDTVALESPHLVLQREPEAAAAAIAGWLQESLDRPAS